MINKNLAIVDKGKIYSYQSIYEIVLSLSKKIFEISNYGKRNPKFGLYLDRDVFLFCSVISVLKCGCTFIPLDIEWPEERRDFILKDCKCDFILTKEKYKDSFTLPSVCVDTLTSEHCDFSSKELPIPNPDDIAYIMYTSGTTGLPKGVAVPYGAVQSFLEDVGKPARFFDQMTLLSFSKPVFDMFLSECLTPFYYGGTIVIADYTALSYRKVFRQIMDWKVNSTIITPSRLQLFLDILGEKADCVLKALRRIYFGGENIPVNLLQLLQDYKIEIYNLYGPTETTILSTVANLTNSSFVHVGKPLKRTRIVIHNPDKNETGEIWISGPGLAKEYINNQRLTEEKFVCVNGTRYYKTADIGFWDDEGNLVLRGRLDNQIKLNGYRIELEEIERVTEKIDTITWAVVFVSAFNKLVLLYQSSMEIQRESLIKYLTKYLPQYMIPSEFLSLDSMSLNSSGKINKKELIKMYNQKILKEKVEKEILELISESLNQHLEIQSSLKSIDSISFIQLLVNIEEKYNFEFPDEMLSYEKLDTVEKIASYLLSEEIIK